MWQIFLCYVVFSFGGVTGSVFHMLLKVIYNIFGWNGFWPVWLYRCWCLHNMWLAVWLIWHHC